MSWRLLAGLAAAALLSSAALPGQDLQSWLNDCVVFHIDRAEHLMGLEYRWQGEIPPGGPEQRVSIRIKGALVAVRCTQ